MQQQWQDSVYIVEPPQFVALDQQMYSVGHGTRSADWHMSVPTPEPVRS